MSRLWSFFGSSALVSLVVGTHAIPLAQVKVIKIRESDNAKPAGLTGLLVLGSLFTAALVSLAMNPPY